MGYRCRRLGGAIWESPAEDKGNNLFQGDVMGKLLTIATAGALAAANLLAPVSLSSARADMSGTTARAYFAISLGGEQPLDQRANLGFQLKKDFVDLETGYNPQFGSTTVLDFAVNRDGLDKATIMGIDAVMIYDLASQQGGLGFGHWEHWRPWHFILGGAVTLGVLCLADVICNESSSSGRSDCDFKTQVNAFSPCVEEKVLSFE